MGRRPPIGRVSSPHNSQARARLTCRHSSRRIRREQSQALTPVRLWLGFRNRQASDSSVSACWVLLLIDGYARNGETVQIGGRGTLTESNELGQRPSPPDVLGKRGCKRTGFELCSRCPLRS